MTDIEPPPLSLENLQHINSLTTIMLHTHTHKRHNIKKQEINLIVPHINVIQFISLSPPHRGGGIESDSRWESQTSLSWEHGCQQLICPILHPLRDCRLAHFAHNKSASSSSVSRCASMNYLTLLSLSLSLTVFSPSVDFSVGLCHFDSVCGPVKLTDLQYDMKKTTTKTILTSRCCLSFLETKIQLILSSCLISSRQNKMLATFLQTTDMFVCITGTVV